MGAYKYHVVYNHDEGIRQLHIVIPPINLYTNYMNILNTLKYKIRLKIHFKTYLKKGLIVNL